MYENKLKDQDELSIIDKDSVGIFDMGQVIIANIDPASKTNNINYFLTPNVTECVMLVIRTKYFAIACHIDVHVNIPSSQKRLLEILKTCATTAKLNQNDTTISEEQILQDVELFLAGGHKDNKLSKDMADKIIKFWEEEHKKKIDKEWLFKCTPNLRKIDVDMQDFILTNTILDAALSQQDPNYDTKKNYINNVDIKNVHKKMKDFVKDPELLTANIITKAFTEMGCLSKGERVVKWYSSDGKFVAFTDKNKFSDQKESKEKISEIKDHFPVLGFDITKNSFFSQNKQNLYSQINLCKDHLGEIGEKIILHKQKERIQQSYLLETWTGYGNNIPLSQLKNWFKFTIDFDNQDALKVKLEFLMNLNVVIIKAEKNRLETFINSEILNKDNRGKLGIESLALPNKYKDLNPNLLTDLLNKKPQWVTYYEQYKEGTTKDIFTFPKSKLDEFNKYCDEYLKPYMKI